MYFKKDDELSDWIIWLVLALQWRFVSWTIRKPTRLYFLSTSYLLLPLLIIIVLSLVISLSFFITIVITMASFLIIPFGTNPSTLHPHCCYLCFSPSPQSSMYVQILSHFQLFNYTSNNMIGFSLCHWQHVWASSKGEDWWCRSVRRETRPNRKLVSFFTSSAKSFPFDVATQLKQQTFRDFLHRHPHQPPCWSSVTYLTSLFALISSPADVTNQCVEELQDLKWRHVGVHNAQNQP